jgi:hypothetical protein
LNNILYFPSLCYCNIAVFLIYFYEKVFFNCRLPIPHLFMFKVEPSKNDPKPIGNDHKSVVSTSVNCPQHQIPNPPGFTPGTCPEAQLQAMNGSYFTLSEENAAYNFRDNLLFTRPIGRDYIIITTCWGNMQTIMLCYQIIPGFTLNC